MTRVELKRRAPARLSDGRMRREPAEHAAERVFVVHVGAETMGLPIDRVRTVFFVGDVARVPLTPPWVLGLINLRGAIVTASRSVIYAFDAGDRDWAGAVRLAAERFRDEIAAGLGVRA